jgi:hypothetical protein
MKFYENWEALTDDRWTLSVIRAGFRLVFLQDPPLTSRPPFSRIPTALANTRHQTLGKEVESLLEKGAVIELFQPFTPGFYSSIFVVPKKNSEKLRLVINLKPLNKLLVKYPFKMETTRSIMASLRQGDWTISVDLRDAYFHIPIHRGSQKFLRFTHGKRVFQFVALPFGLAPAPYVFTKIMMTVGRAAHKRMLHLFLYLDDSLMRNTSRQTLALQVPVLLRIFDVLGFIRNDEKSELVPKQIFTFLGVWYDLLAAVAKVPQDRWQKIQRIISSILTSVTSPARTWCVALGLLTSAQDLVVLGRLHIRRLQIHLNKHWVPRLDLTVPIPLTEDCRNQFQWWLQMMTADEGVSILPFAPSINIFTDASSTGWGAHVGDTLLSGSWTLEEKELHINNLEMLAVIRTVSRSVNLLLNSHVLLSTDNSTVVSYINRQGGTHSSALCALTEELLMFLHKYGVTLKANHIPGCRNVLADALSRSGKIISTEWTLHPEAFRQICSLWGLPQLDLFATRYNNLLPEFVSPYPDEKAVAVDALSLDWEGFVAYAYPPTVLIPKVLEKIRVSTARVLLIAPAWPARAWFPALLELLEDVPWRLPPWQKLLRQPRSSVYSKNTQALDLHAWPLSGRPSVRQDFLKRWRLEYPSEIEDRLTGSTNPGGLPSRTGVDQREWTLSRPLFQ